MPFRAHPFARVLLTIAAVVAATSHSLIVLAVLNVVFLLFGWRIGTLKSQGRLLVTGVLPLGLILAVVWGGFLQTAPGLAPGSDPSAGLQHALTLSLRIGLLGSAFQAIWLSIESRQVPAFLQSLGLRGDWLIQCLAFLGGFQLVRQTTEHIFTALVIRGQIRRGNWLSLVGAVPHVLANIWVPTISLALSRIRYKWKPVDFLSIAQLPAGIYPTDYRDTVLAVGVSVAGLLAPVVQS